MLDFILDYGLQTVMFLSFGGFFLYLPMKGIFERCRTYEAHLLGAGPELSVLLLSKLTTRLVEQHAMVSETSRWRVSRVLLSNGQRSFDSELLAEGLRSVGFVGSIWLFASADRLALFDRLSGNIVGDRETLDARSPSVGGVVFDATSLADGTTEVWFYNCAGEGFHLDPAKMRLVRRDKNAELAALALRAIRLFDSPCAPQFWGTGVRKSLIEELEIGLHSVDGAQRGLPAILKKAYS
jgi:hypothetical protein